MLYTSRNLPSWQLRHIRNTFTKILLAEGISLVRKNFLWRFCAHMFDHNPPHSAGRYIQIIRWFNHGKLNLLNPVITNCFMEHLFLWQPKIDRWYSTGIKSIFGLATWITNFFRYLNGRSKTIQDILFYHIQSGPELMVQME